MSDQKLLTICLPTYNRAKYLKMQLENFASMPQKLWEDIRIFISDNCSSDDTQSLGREFSRKEGVDIIYHRNDSNLGMDGNFVTCFKSAKSKYVWLLGDDDTIIIEKLSLLISFLKKEEIGLLHIGFHNNRTDEVASYYFNDEIFLHDIKIYITFISANIVNVKYVQEVNFDKYYGSYFTLIPLYLTAMIKEPKNLMLNCSVFEGFKDLSRNGGYNYIEVFVLNYLRIFKEFVDNNLLSQELYEYEKKISFDFTISFFLMKVLLRRNVGNYSSDGAFKIMIEHFGYCKVIKGTLLELYKIVKNKILK